MPARLALVTIIALLSWNRFGLATEPAAPARTEAGKVTAHSQGLHGYIGFSTTQPPARSEYSAGMGFYSAVWPLIDEPLANFQIGLPSTWILPDNADNKDKPLAPEGTLARQWPERGPTWESVFQTVEGGLGYWAGNHFRYGPPKFSMNGTPQCYDYEVASPGWSFFYSDQALPDHRLGIAQLSNRLLIPPDGLPFRGHPNGQFLGYTYLALPLTDAAAGDPPTGDQSWTCFLSAANFQGPIAFYIPETWSKIGKLFKYPFIYGRGLDARPGNMGGGAMEINTVPRFDARDAQGVVYSKIPRLRFPVDRQGRTLLVQDVTYYSKAALYDAVKAWRDGGPACSGRFNVKGAWKPALTTSSTRYDQAGTKLTGVERVFDTKVFEGNVWGLKWVDGSISPKGLFPQYYKHVGEECVAIAAADVPAETHLRKQQFPPAERGRALHFTDDRRLESARAENRTVHGRTCRRVPGNLRMVPFHRPAFLSAVPLERGKKGETTGPCGENPCELAHSPELHAAARPRGARRPRSGVARNAAQGAGNRLRPHRNAPVSAVSFVRGKRENRRVDWKSKPQKPGAYRTISWRDQLPICLGLS